jgi:hypothetical protein
MNVSLVAGQGLLREELFVALVALVLYPQVNLHVEKKVSISETWKYLPVHFWLPRADYDQKLETGIRNPDPEGQK